MAEASISQGVGFTHGTTSTCMSLNFQTVLATALIPLPLLPKPLRSNLLFLRSGYLVLERRGAKFESVAMTCYDLPTSPDRSYSPPRTHGSPGAFAEIGLRFFAWLGWRPAVFRKLWYNDSRLRPR